MYIYIYIRIGGTMKAVLKNKYFNILVAAFFALPTAFCRLLADQSDFSWHVFTYSNHGYAGMFYFIAISVLFSKYLFKAYKNNVLVWVLGLFSAFINQLYYIYVICDIAKLQGYEKGAFVLVFILNILFYKSLFTAVLESFDNLISKEISIDNHSKNAIKLRFFLILSVIYGLNYIAMFPGTIQYDSASMIQIVYGIRPLSVDNPLMQIGFMWIFKQVASLIGSTFALGIYTFIQNILVIILLSEVLVRLHRLSKALSYGMLLAFIVLPPFMHYANSVGKDYPFSLAILYLSILLYDLIENTDELLNKKSFAVKLSLAIFLVSVLRNVGLYLAVASAFVLCVFLLVKYKKKAIILSVSLVSTIFISVIGLNGITMAIGAAPEKKSANKSISLMQIARIHTVLGKKAFTDFEYESISKGMDIVHTNMYYREGYSDYIKDLYYEDISEADEKNFNKAYRSLIKRNWKTAFQATYLNSYAYFIPGITTKEKPIYFFENYNMDNLSKFINPKSGNRFKNLSIKYTFLMDKLPSGFLKSTGFINYFHFIMLIALLDTKRRKYIIVVLPAIFYAIGLVGSPINGYYRYCLPTLLTMGTSLLAFAGAKKSLDNSTLSLDKE